VVHAEVVPARPGILPLEHPRAGMIEKQFGILYECELGMWCHKSLPGLPVWHLKVQRWTVQNLECGNNAVCYAARWRLAGIDYLDFNDERVATVVGDDPAAFDTKIGSQLAFGGFSIVTEG
jgi:hypothetical protein